MSNKEFDKEIKRKIDSFHFQTDHTPDWQGFSEILRNEEGFEDIDFDKSIKKSVSNHKTIYKSDHWLQLKNRLEKEGRIHQHVYISKGAEMFSVMLLVFAFVQYFLSDVYHLPTHIPPAKPLLERAGILPPLQKGKPVKFDFASNKNITPSETVDGSKSMESNFDLNLNNVKALNPDASENKTLVALDPILVRSCQLDMAKEKLPPSRKEVIESKIEKTKIFITPLLSMGIAITNSPGNIATNQEGKSLLSTNFSAGFLYSKQYDNIEVASGIIAGRKNYRPTPQAIYTVKDRMLYEETVENISYDFATIPFRAKYLFGTRNHDLKPYIHAGVDVSFLLNTKYDINARDLGVVATSGIANTPRNEQNKATPEGLLSGGSLANNLYLSVFTEAGIEKKLSDNNSVTMGLAYSKYFNIEGLGPNRDKFDNLTFNVGIKHALND